MEGNKEDYYSLDDIVSHLLSFFHFLRKRVLWMLLTAVAGCGLGVLYYYVQKPKYEAVTTFILEEKSSGGGGLAGIASQFGFDIGSLSGGGSIFTGDNILDILRSKKVVYTVLLSKVGDNTNPQDETLADLFLHFSGWKKKWTSDPELNKISFANCKEGQLLPQKQDSILNEIHEFFTVHELSAERLNKKGSIIRVQVTAPNSVFARLMTERLVEAAANLYLNLKTGTAQNNIAKLQHRSDSLLILLNRKSYAVAANQPLDINPGIKSAIVPIEIASRDKSVLATLYAEVTKNLEASKLILSQQTPVIQRLDSPGYLLDDNKKSLFFLSIVSPITAALIFVICAFPLFLFKNRKGRQKIESIEK